MSQAVNALVVEDNAGVRQLVGTILGGLGARVLQASNASEAFDLLENDVVDVLFIDLRLPDADGLDVIRESAQLRPRIAFVVFTGAATLESAVEALRLGACDFLVKPVARQEIVSAFGRARGFRQFKQSMEAPPRELQVASPLRQVDVVAASPQMHAVVALACRVAPMHLPVLIRGETGVGKKLLARMIHSRSGRPETPFVHVICASLPDSPSATELPLGQRPRGFSHVEQWDCLADAPGGGTLFLQDVDKLPLWAQIRLLDTLEDTWIQPSATDEGRLGRVRVIASTTSSLEADVESGQFHRGLYDYLNVAPIKIPPLRERPQDIDALARHFLERFRRVHGGKNLRNQVDISDEVSELLPRYRWPGNARELASVMARAVLAKSGIGVDSSIREYLRMSTVPRDTGETISVPLAGDLKAIERHVIREVVRRHRGNKAAAARALGMHRRSLYRALDNTGAVNGDR